MNTLSAADWLQLFGHFLSLSLLAVGGAITTAPDMHRYVVEDRGWLSDAGFTASVAIAQAAPGPNVLFVAVIGWNVAGALGAAVTLLGTLLPSSVLTYSATRWGRARRETLGVRAFVAGMAPVTLGLLLATGWILAEPAQGHPGALLLVLVTVLVMWRTRLGPLWMVATGAAAGAFGLV